MRAITSAASLGLLLLAAVAGATVHHPEPMATAPWQITQDFTVKLPSGGIQLEPAFTNIPDLYVAGLDNGDVVAVNTTSRAVQWTKDYDDIAFISALQTQQTIFVARYSGTTVLDVQGNVVWESSKIQMVSNLDEAYNALVFDTTIVYRDQSEGYDRLCAVDGTNGNQLWCDKRHLYDSPDYALNGTFTAVFFDVNSSSYVANLNAADGSENWFAYAERVFTGSPNFVAVRQGAAIYFIDSMTGLRLSSTDLTNVNYIMSSVFVDDVFAFTDGNFYVAAINVTNGDIIWNATAPTSKAARRVELQKNTPGLVIAAVLSWEHTNFTKLDRFTGENLWTVSAKPTGMSLAPVHAWLGTDVLYVRNTQDRWSAWGAISGEQISSGSGDLFLPRSVRSSFDRPHFSFYVTTNAGEMINLRVEPRN